MITYSPKTITVYPWAASSALLRSEPEIWNLAWLSYAPEHGSRFHAHFTSATGLTCKCLRATVAADLIGMQPRRLKVAGLMDLPPPAALKRLTEAPGLLEMPLYKLFGSEWLRIMELRAREYREPHNPALDAEVLTLAQASKALSVF